METARIFSRKLSPKRGSVQKEGLAPRDPVDEILADIEREKKNLMIVGHLPFLKKLASLALAGSGATQMIDFKPGGIVSLQKMGGRWQVMFALIPDLLIG